MSLLNKVATALTIVLGSVARLLPSHQPFTRLTPMKVVAVAAEARG